MPAYTPVKRAHGNPPPQALPPETELREANEARMKKILEPGISGTSEITVSEDMLANRVGSGLVEVFSTAMMIAWMEATAVAVVQDALPEGMTTVGTKVDVVHVAATPCGMQVTFTAELTGMSSNGKGLTFKVSARDEVGLIGEGTHERVVVHKEKFESRTRHRKDCGC